jgi:hypothetical protein
MAATKKSKAGLRRRGGIGLSQKPAMGPFKPGKSPQPTVGTLIRQERVLAAKEREALRLAQAAERKADRAKAKYEREELKAKYKKALESARGAQIPIMSKRMQFITGADRPVGLPIERKVRFLKTAKSGQQTIMITGKQKRRFKTKESAQKYVDKLGGVTLLSGAVTLAAFGAMDFAGLTEALPTQKYTGISLAGWIGVGSLILARWVFSSPTVKDASYAVGLSLVAYEVTRQIKDRFADWYSLGDNWSGVVYALDAPSAQSQGPLMWGGRIAARQLARQKQMRQLSGADENASLLQQFMQQQSERDVALMDAIKGSMQRAA